MPELYYQNNELYLEKVNLRELAERFSTPTYIYSQTMIEQNWQSFADAFHDIPHMICYAVKANSNIHILKLLAEKGAGFDIVSQGELERVLRAGGNPKQIIFSGVGKQTAELESAIDAGIYCFNVESEAEIDRLNKLATARKQTLNITLRVNPNVDPHTHTFISTGLKENKFGIELSQIIPICRKLKEKKALNLIGIACHIGSQLTKLKPFLLAIDRLLEMYTQINKLGFQLQHINIGGGLGITYQDEQPPSIVDYAKAVMNKIYKTPLCLILEPGRRMIGDAGFLLTRVEYIKLSDYKNFAIVDAGMNDLIRPALYDAWQNIVPVNQRQAKAQIYDIAGPVCESADFLGKNRKLAISANDLLVVTACGAYGFSMASNYNSRGRPAEVLVHGETMKLIRKRENIEHMLALEMTD